MVPAEEASGRVICHIVVDTDGRRDICFTCQELGRALRVVDVLQRPPTIFLEKTSTAVKVRLSQIPDRILQFPFVAALYSWINESGDI
jgi:hypothetical protein